MFFSPVPSDARQPPAAPDGWALVTGAATGIGRAFAFELATRGVPLVLVDRDHQPLIDTARELEAAHGIAPITLPQDLSDPASPQTIFDLLQQKGIELSLLINNAAVGMHAPIDQQPADRIEEMVRVNVLSVVHLTRLFLEPMRQRGRGTIVNVSSAGIFDPCPNWTVYGATKAFVLHFTESLQAELNGTGVNVAAVCPGITRTSFFARAGHDEPGTHGAVQTPEQVAAEAMRGLERNQPLIVTGFSNRIRVQSQRANLRRVLAAMKRQLRKVALIS